MGLKENSLIVFKYGGNAMADAGIKQGIVSAISKLHQNGHQVVVVHGGGPFIKEALARAGVTSEFIDGQRKTSAQAMKVVEETLKGKVNADLVGLFNREGTRAVGLSGKDGKMVTATKRKHMTQIAGVTQSVDLGRVGNVDDVNPDLIILLLAQGYIPVITCVASDKDGTDYNINGDNFAGHIAGALKADEFIVLTDVDGLLIDINKADSLIQKTDCAELETLKAKGVIKGGMIPKTDACCTALQKGARSARIVNGTKPDIIENLLRGDSPGTLIVK